MRLVEESHIPKVVSPRVCSYGEPKLTTFSEATDDIEAYLINYV